MAKRMGDMLAQDSQPLNASSSLASLDYSNQVLGELAGQMLIAPLQHREGYIPRVEDLHDSLDLAGTYPLAYVKYRATGHRVQGGDDVMLIGEPLLADLRQMIGDLCRSVTLLPSEGEDTVESLADRLSVSTKTVHRWRKQGLRYRWVKPLGARKHRLAFPVAAIEAFDRLNPGRVKNASERTWHSEHDKARLIERAQRLQRETGAGISRISEHLAKRTGRARETIRLILSHHDDQRRNDAHDGDDTLEALIFPDHKTKLTDRDKRLAARAAQRGIKIGRIAERLNRSRSVVQRVVRQTRLAEQRLRKLVYIQGPTFTHADAQSIFSGPPLPLQPADATESLIRLDASTDGLPEPVCQWFAPRPLQASVVQGWIVRRHYALFAADQVRRAIDEHDPRMAELNTFDQWLARSLVCRAQTVGMLLPVVLSVCRQELGAQDIADTLDSAGVNQRLISLLIAGHAQLYPVLDDFDPFRGRDASIVPLLRTRLTTHFARQDSSAANASPNPSPSRATRRMTPEQITAAFTREASKHGVVLSS